MQSLDLQCYLETYGEHSGAHPRPSRADTLQVAPRKQCLNNSLQGILRLLEHRDPGTMEGKLLPAFCLLPYSKFLFSHKWEHILPRNTQHFTFSQNKYLLDDP